MSVTARLSGYGISASISARVASVARHSAASRSTTRAALAVSVTFLLRASGPAVVRTQPAARIAATFWLSAEWVSCTDARADHAAGRGDAVHGRDLGRGLRRVRGRSPAMAGA